MNEYECGKTSSVSQRVTHIFLDPEIVHRNIEVQRRRHCHRRQIRRAVAACPHMINLRQRSDLLEMGQASAVHHRHAEVVDQLFLDENVGVPNRIEDLANREWRCRMLTNDAEALLQFCGHRVFQPE